MLIMYGSIKGQGGFKIKVHVFTLKLWSIQVHKTLHLATRILRKDRTIFLLRYYGEEPCDK